MDQFPETPPTVINNETAKYANKMHKNSIERHGRLQEPRKTVENIKLFPNTTEAPQDEDNSE